MTTFSGGVPVSRIETASYRVPTDLAESDGTLEWHATTLVLVRAHGGNTVGLGYTYADTSTAKLIHDLLSGVVEGHDVMSPAACWKQMVSRTRNLGRPEVSTRHVPRKALCGLAQSCAEEVDGASRAHRLRSLGVRGDGPDVVEETAVMSATRPSSFVAVLDSLCTSCIGGYERSTLQVASQTKSSPPDYVLQPGPSCAGD